MTVTRHLIRFDLGTFEGFNFRDQCAIEQSLSAQEVIDWDHDQHGEAEFWPSGDHAGVFLIFNHKSSVTAHEIISLDRLLEELGDDSLENSIRIYHAMSVSCGLLSQLKVESVEDQMVHIFVGTSFLDLRRDAAFELFELYYPETYAAWERTPCDGLIFDRDIFLDSPSFSTEELCIPGAKILLVAPQ